MRSAKEHLFAAIPQATEKRIILYAPTFRGQTHYAVSPDVVDLDRLSAAVGRDSVLLIKHHPFVKERPAIPAGSKDFAFDVTDILTIEELLCVCDLCISDYSSLVFEYSLFERPMIFFAHDLEDYFDWRGFYYDYKSFVPGPIVRTTDELIEVLTHPDEHIDLERVRAFRQKYMSACDGHATERILDRIGLLKKSEAKQL